MNDKDFFRLTYMAVLLLTLCTKPFEHSFILALHIQPDFLDDGFGGHITISKRQQYLSFGASGVGYLLGLPYDFVVFQTHRHGNRLHLLPDYELRIQVHCYLNVGQWLFPLLVDFVLEDKLDVG